MALYAATLGYGLVNYDDTWLYSDNWVVRQPSLASLKIIFGELALDRRMVLGAEYLPIRDLSVMLDYAVWGTRYGGFHATSLALYLASIALWFKALEAFGIDRRIAGITVLLWALHPTHAESVAWLAERKGVLAMAFAGVAALGYARFRTGARAIWLALAMVAAICAVWSKAHGAFAIGALAALEVALPGRQSWRRSLVGLGAIAAVAVAAFVPVIMLASSATVIDSHQHARDAATILGSHGFYLQQMLLLEKSSVSFPVATSGPTSLDIAIGAAGLVLAALAWRGPRELRAASGWWLVTWLPISHLIVTLQALVAERYLLVPSLGFALAVAVGISRIPIARARYALVAAIVIACSLRTLIAREMWRDSETLWQNAVAVNPADGGAWSMYGEVLMADGKPERAQLVVDEGLRHSQHPRLLQRKALFLVGTDRAAAISLLRRAADAGEYRAMTNLALLLHDDGKTDEALDWARRAVAKAPLYAAGQRAVGKIALATGRAAEALPAFEHAYALEPKNLANRFNLALALLALDRRAEARAHLEACLADPELGPRARSLL